MAWFSRLFRRRRKVRGSREERLSAIQAMGYEVVQDMPAAIKGYVLRSPEGELLDNLGMGYANSGKALEAARKHASAKKGGSVAPVVIAMAILTAPAVGHAGHVHRTARPPMPGRTSSRSSRRD